MRRFVIIGTGVAGISAAETIRREMPKADILILGDESYGFYSRPGLAFYLTGEINAEQLYPYSQEDFQRLSIRPLHARVSHILPSEHRLRLHDGTTISYDRLLVATGAQAARFSMPGSELQGVVKLDNLDDAKHILRQIRRGGTAVVVGGGITALELVEGLRARGEKTHYLLRKDRYWGNVLDETESRIIEGRLREEGVRIHYHTELAEIHGKNGRLESIKTQDGRTIKCHLLAIAIGIRPRKELAESAHLDADRGILVNQYMQTSDPHIFAAGDVAQVYDPYIDQYVLDSLWGPAREQGRIAGLNMIGERVAYRKTMAFNVTRLAGLTTTIIGTVGHGTDDDLIGIARGDSETWRQPPDAITAQAGFEINRLRILVGKENLLGAIVMGDQSLSRALHHLIRDQVDISPIRSQLLKPNAPVFAIIAGFWTMWKSTRTSKTI